MLESLVSGRTVLGATYPNSGPGPKTLRYGDESLGYFGEVSSSEFFTTSEIQRQLNYYEGVVDIESPAWAKTMVDGRVIFIPLKFLSSGVTWNGAYAAGAIYPEWTVGRFPATPERVQDAVVAKDDYRFKVYAPAVTTDDPYTAAATLNMPDAGGSGADWCRLIMAMTRSTLSGYTGPRWPVAGLVGDQNDPFTVSAGGLARLCRTSYAPSASAITSASLITGPVNSNGYCKTASKTAALRWMPFLELVDFSNRVLGVKDPSYTTPGVLRPATLLTPTVIDSDAVAIQSTSVRQVSLVPLRITTTEIIV